MKQIPNGGEIAKSSTRHAAKAVEEKSSRLGGIVFFLLCAVLVFAPTAYGAVDVWALGVVTIIAGLIVIFWAADSWKRGEIRFSASLLQIPLWALILIGLIQLLPLRAINLPNDLLALPVAGSLSLEPYATRLAVVQLIVYAIFFAAALTFINTQKRMRQIVFVIIIFSAVTAFFGILQRFASPDGIYGLRPTPFSVPFAAFVNQHHFAAFMEMGIGLTISLLYARATKRDKTILLITAAVFMGVGLILTSSRGGILGLLGVLFFVMLANFFRKNDAGESVEKSSFKSKIAIIGAGAALLVILFGATLLLGGGDSLARGVGLNNPNDVSNGRSHFWSVALQIFINYPLIGAGLDSFGTVFPHFDTWNGRLRVDQAHNDYLQILADAGIAGFLCIAAFIYFLFKNGLFQIRNGVDRFQRATAIGALAGCFGILVHSFVDFPLRTPSNTYYFLTLAALATAVSYAPKLRAKRIGENSRLSD